MNLVFYTGKLSDGGAERVMSVLANGLANRNHNVTMVLGKAMPNEYTLDPKVERVVLDDANISYTWKNRVKRLWNRHVKLRSICKRKKADVLISFLNVVNFAAILATRFLKTKNLISVRNDPKVAYSGAMNAWLARVLYPMAEGCVFQTAQAQQWFPKTVQKKSRIILNPVADVFYHVTPVSAPDKRIVTCGRLDEQKRFDLLIDAFDRICDEFPQYRLEIYGEGHLHKALQSRIDDLGRQERIRLMGRSMDVPNTIKGASLFVLSSDYEGLPNALMEAMALGLPVISTDCGGGGARALIEHGKDGLIVPCGDIDALADAMRQNLADPVGANSRGRQAAEKAKSFSGENIVTLWEAYIKQISVEHPDSRKRKTKES